MNFAKTVDDFMKKTSKEFEKLDVNHKDKTINLYETISALKISTS